MTASALSHYTTAQQIYSALGNPGQSKRNFRQDRHRIEPHIIGIPVRNVARSAGSARSGDSLLIQLLWLAFPSTSAKALAEKAAPVLGKQPRQIENILAGRNDGKAEDVERLLRKVRIFHGVEKLAQIIEGKSVR